MPFVTVPDGTHLYYERSRRRVNPCYWSAVRGRIIPSGMGFATTSRTAIVSSSLITEEQVRATSQALLPIRHVDLLKMRSRCLIS